MEREPLIDLVPFYGPPGSGRTALARSVEAARRDIGFIVVTGHRVPAATVAAAMAAYHAPRGRAGGWRMSIVFIHNTNEDALVECIETCRSAAQPAKYPPVTAGEHVMAKFRRQHVVAGGRCAMRGVPQTLSAVTLATVDMARAVAFYEAMGFEALYGGRMAAFTSFRLGRGYLNIIAVPAERRPRWWGRVIVHVDDVDAAYARALAQGYRPEAPPRDADWNERYFHLTDPDGHEVSFARPLGRQEDA